MGTRVCICPSCRILMTYSSNVKTCPQCGHALEGSFTGIAKEYDVEVGGTSPHAEDALKLKSTPFEKLAVSKFEVQRAINWILIGIISAPILMLFGSWVIREFRGPGVLFFGYGSLLAGPILLFLGVTNGLGLILGDPRGKTARKAFEKIWRDALFDAGSASTANQYTGSKKTGYLYRRFLRSIHPLHRNVSEQETAEYMDGLRKIARTYFDETAASLDLKCRNSKGTEFGGTWENSYGFASNCEVVSEDTDHAVVQGKISLNFEKTCKISDKVTYNLPAAVVHFNVKQRYVKCGDYWAPLDPLPAVINQ